MIHVGSIIQTRISHASINKSEPDRKNAALQRLVKEKQYPDLVHNKATFTKKHR